jgi:hypothetical protein
VLLRRLSTGLLVFAIACSRGYRLPRFHPDKRYERVLQFDSLTSIPITHKGFYVRFDGVISDLDLDVHQAELLREFGIPASSVRYTNSAQFGRGLRVEFAGGERCDIVWVKADHNPLVTKGRLAHEKYHVLAHLAPDRVVDLDHALAAKGLPVVLGSFDEETAASLIEVATIHLLGAPMEDIHGTYYIQKATKVLSDARRSVARERDRR